MSCPDWKLLVRHRYAGAGEPPARWADALVHLEGCARCRRRALEADPTLVFRRAAAAGCAPGERDRIRDAVRDLRRTRGLERSRRRRGLRRYGSAAAVLALVVSAVVMGIGGGVPVPEPAPEPPPAAMRFGDLVVPALDLAAPPLIEALDRPDARVYQLPQEDLSLVMIVDESLDV